MSRRRRHRRSAGFTLLEVMIALAVLAIGLGYVYHATSEGFAWIENSRDQRIALAVAQSVMTRVGVDIPVQDGRAEGLEGTYAWHLDTTSSNDRSEKGGLAIHQVVVTVEWHRLGFRRQVRLTSMRADTSNGNRGSSR